MSTCKCKYDDLNEDYDINFEYHKACCSEPSLRTISKSANGKLHNSWCRNCGSLNHYDHYNHNQDKIQYPNSNFDLLSYGGATKLKEKVMNEPQKITKEVIESLPNGIYAIFKDNSLYQTIYVLGIEGKKRISGLTDLHHVDYEGLKRIVPCFDFESCYIILASEVKLDSYDKGFEAGEKKSDNYWNP